MKKPMYQIPECRKMRVIIDTDCANEADDQFAVAHALLTPKFDVKGIVSVHYSEKYDKNSEELSYEEIIKVLTCMNMDKQISVYHGSNKAMKDEKIGNKNEGVRFIIKEAMKQDKTPLFVVCQGALTNIASALILKPEIADRLTVVWIGGGVYPQGGGEFNLHGDINAANVLMDSSVEIWQIPLNVYQDVMVSYVTLIDQIYSCGEIGRYLVENMFRVAQLERNYTYSKIQYADCSAGALAAANPGGESWRLGDSAWIGVLMTDHYGHYNYRGAPRFKTDMMYELRDENKHRIRIYEYIDSQFILNDMFAKLRYYFQ